MPIKGKPTKRLGARYGATVRKRLAAIERVQKAKYPCPNCGKKDGVKWLSVGIWYCRKCGFKFAGGAYNPKLEVVKEMLERKWAGERLA